MSYLTPKTQEKIKRRREAKEAVEEQLQEIEDCSDCKGWDCSKCPHSGYCDKISYWDEESLLIS